MTAATVERRPARATATLAAAVAGAAALALGWLTGLGAATALGVAAAALLAAGARALDEPARRSQAGGSVAATAGAVALVGALGLSVGVPGGWLAAAASFGVALVAVDAAVGVYRDRERTLTEALRESGNAILLGIVASALVNLAVVYGVVPALFGGVLALSTATPLVGFVTLQAFALVVALLVPKAVAVLERWVPGNRDRSGRVLDSLEGAGVAFTDVPLAYWTALALQFFAALVPQANALFERAFGPVLGPPLTSGLIHGALGTVALGLCGVLFADLLRAWTVTWFGDDPGATLALQAGGFAATGLVVPVAAALVFVEGNTLDGLLSAAVARRVAVVGLPTLALGGLALVVLFAVVALNVPRVLGSAGVVPERGGGFAAGAASLFAAALGAATVGAPALAVLAGVAAALFAWDAGAHATSVGRRLGQAAETRRSEFVHVTGTGAVLAVAVGLAALARYAVVPALAPARRQSTAGPAALSLAFVLVAVLAFVAALYLRERARGT